MINATGRRAAVIVSPYGTAHAPRRSLTGQYVRRLDWRITLCGQLAEYGWSQRIAYGYVTCKTCIGLLERKG